VTRTEPKRRDPKTQSAEKVNLRPHSTQQSPRAAIISLEDRVRKLEQDVKELDGIIMELSRKRKINKRADYADDKA
jgi:TolA-binding protein